MGEVRPGYKSGMVTKAQSRRQQQIVDVLDDAFADLMKADPHAFRVKFRKMAADPFAFYRGSACLFYADMWGPSNTPLSSSPTASGRPMRRDIRGTTTISAMPTPCAR